MYFEKIGRYEIISEIGRGGMSTVFRAFDPRCQREVAIKVLPHELLHDPSFRARFEREARVLATLEEPAIVPVYDFGEEDGLPYLVMRYMPGGSLEERLKQGPVPLDEAAHIFHHLAPAIDVAHARGIIHRDLKPGNILFDAHGNPYLSDFGIVKLAEGTATTLTGNMIIGTPAFMSPEQGRGEADLDGRGDVYALGSILFLLLSGKLPYEAATPTGLIIKHITEPIPDLLALQPNLPVSCQFIIERAMAKDREQRFETAGELAQALMWVAGGGAMLELKPPVLAASAPVSGFSGNGLPGHGQTGKGQTTLLGVPLSEMATTAVKPAAGPTPIQSRSPKTPPLPPEAAVPVTVSNPPARPGRRGLAAWRGWATRWDWVAAIGVALLLLLLGFGIGAAVLSVLPRLQSLTPAETSPAAALASPATAQIAVTSPPSSTAILPPSARATLPPTTISLPGRVVRAASAFLSSDPGETDPEIASHSTSDPYLYSTHT